ncbi:MAG: hypothetical protein KGN36_12880, partial [Acidobacteriota bacterium]|nr:hypothetical protein [Acidobacteriota bacterium]
MTMVEFARKTGRVIASAVPLVLGALLIWLLVPWWIRGGVFYIAVVLVSLRAPLSRITVAAAATATAVIA